MGFVLKALCFAGVVLVLAVPFDTFVSVVTGFVTGHPVAAKTIAICVLLDLIMTTGIMESFESIYRDVEKGLDDLIKELEEKMENDKKVIEKDKKI